MDSIVLLSNGLHISYVQQKSQQCLIVMTNLKTLIQKLSVVSTDTIHTHLAWINTDRKDNGLGQLKYPLAADTNHEVSRDYGVLIEEEGVALRGSIHHQP